MAVNLTLRRNKGAALTHNELDDNFAELANAGIDSSAIIAMIDSAYVQARQFGLDSALVTQLIDSDYINSKIDDFTQTVYHYIDSNSGQTQFTGLDKYSKRLAVNPKTATVYINGVLQTPDDYVFNSVGTLITLATPTDSDDIVTIVSIDGGVIGMDSASVQRLIDSDYIQARDRFRDSSFVSSIVDSSYVKSFIDSAHVTGLIDSHVTNLIDSDYISDRSGVTTTSVANSYAGVTPLAVGSIMVVNNFNSDPGSSVSIGGNIAGSYLAGVNQNSGGYYNIGATGTWKNLGGSIIQYNVGGQGSIFIRIA